MYSSRSFFPLVAWVLLNFAALIELRPLSAAESVVILPPTRVGEAIELVQTSTRERTGPGQPATKGNSITPIHLEVIASNDTETVMGWTFGRTTVEGRRFNPKTAAVTDPLIDLVAGQTLEIVLDEAYTPVELRNLDDIMVLTKKMVDVMDKSLPEDPAKAAAIPRVREMFSNASTTQSIMLQQPGRYFLAYGWELEPGLPREAEMALPSPFGGEPLPAKVTVELKPIQDANEYYVVTYRQDLDQVGVERVIRETLQKLAGDKPIPPDQLPQFDVQDRGEFHIHRATGWVHQAEVTRTTRGKDVTQIDKLEFRRPQ
jgi:hypothetical protein